MLAEREIQTVEGLKLYRMFEWTPDIDKATVRWKYIRCYSKDEPRFDKILVNVDRITLMKKLPNKD